MPLPFMVLMQQARHGAELVIGPQQADIRGRLQLAQVSPEPNDGSERAEPCTERTSLGKTTGRMFREYCLMDACHTLDNDRAQGHTRTGRRNKLHQAQNSDGQSLAQASRLARLKKKIQSPVELPAKGPKRAALQIALILPRSKVLGP